MRKTTCKISSFLLRLGPVLALLLTGHNAQAEFSEASDDSLSTRLANRVTAVWRGQELGEVIQRLATAERIPFWIDRRVDTSQPVDFQCNNLPVKDILQGLTKENSLAWSELGRLCYLGPSETAGEIASLIQLTKEVVQKLPASQRSVWLSESAVNWPHLSEPRSLLRNWLDGNGIRLLQADLIPHDLWAAKELPPLTLVERVVLLLAGFELTCQISPNGKECIVVPIKRPLIISRIYKTPPMTDALLKQIEMQTPEIQITKQGRGYTIKGPWEVHRKIDELLFSSTYTQNITKPPQTAGRHQRFSLRLKNKPLGKVIVQIAQQTGLQVVWDEHLLEDKPNVREQLISCEVEHVELATLLESLLEQAGIGYRIEANELILSSPTN